ncbi:MAG: HAD hydrolase-like protein [Chitinophagales bacterium]|nr:HAD hydrolase-like protein [Chitinophagales bacterium]MCO5281225.1 HAD hydrolase-like protein [Chitinophagales bacterium]HRN94440.1 HAD hydrolase-like protein [Chitinophagales bacterium]HRP38120.1 HAD hydrolase-like protein [Chitinophagales bacterium]
MAIKLAVFDISGTTVEDKDYVAEALVKAFEKQDLFISHKHANTKMGKPKPLVIRELLNDIFEETPEDFEALVSNIHADFIQTMIDFYQTDKNVKAKTNAVRTMLALKNAGVKVALDTGFSKQIADAIIDRLGWDIQQVVDFWVASDEVKQGRPHADMVLKAMEIAGVTDSKEVAKIGDTESDLGEGTAAGCKYIIGLTTGAQPRSVLEKTNHTHLVDDLYEVVNIVLN